MGRKICFIEARNGGLNNNLQGLARRRIGFEVTEAGDFLSSPCCRALAAHARTVVTDTTAAKRLAGLESVRRRPAMPTVPAIVNAVQEASGVGIFELPLKPKRVYMAIKEYKLNKEQQIRVVGEKPRAGSRREQVAH